MRQKNVVPIMMLQSSASVANGHLADKWHDPEIVAGERLEAWDDLTGLSLNPRGVLEARQKELDYIKQKQVLGDSLKGQGQSERLEGDQIQVD